MEASPMPAPDGIVSALFRGDYKSLVMILVIFGITHYGVYLLGLIGAKLKAAVAYMRGRANELPILSQTTIDDRFFDLLDKAVSNQLHVNAALVEAAADGTLDASEMPKILDAVFADFKANTGLADWSQFALALFGSTREVTADGSPSPSLRGAVEAKIRANLPRTLGELSHRVGERRLERRIKARGLLQPPPPPPQLSA